VEPEQEDNPDDDCYGCYCYYYCQGKKEGKITEAHSTEREKRFLRVYFLIQKEGEKIENSL
jgi:hypothetical protein